MRAATRVGLGRSTLCGSQDLRRGHYFLCVTEPYPPEYPHPHDQPQSPPDQLWANTPVPVDPPVLTIGDIAITRTEVILPQGRFPLRGTTWTVQDSTHVESVIPAYAFVLMIIFIIFFCLLGLLFLLIQEKRYSGFVAVAVTGPGFYHSVQLPAGPNIATWANYQVNQARALAAMA